METVTLVPLPRGKRLMVKSPPNKAARSRMPNSPIESVLEISVLEIPRPLSFTSKIMSPSVAFKLTSTCVAPA